MEMAARLGLEVWRGIKLKTLSEGYLPETSNLKSQTSNLKLIA
jgi:hypothetical protein